MLFIAFGSALSCYAEDYSDLLQYYQEKEKLPLPRQLYNAYQKLIAATARADAGDINQCCLPHSVTFTYEPRPIESREYGQDINIPFLKSGFDKYIRNIRKDAEGCYLIRTGSTALWFIETKSLGWRLYRYLDKPIK